MLGFIYFWISDLWGIRGRLPPRSGFGMGYEAPARNIRLVLENMLAHVGPELLGKVVRGIKRNA